MLANNETGVLQPVERAARLCQQAGAMLHTDAVQVVGKLPVDFRQLGVDMLTAAAHKFHGPRGIGVLIASHRLALSPILYGGSQQAELRPGTEPVALAVGMHAAIRAWSDESAVRIQRWQALRDRFESRLRAGLPELIINGAGTTRLPHVANVAFPGLDRQALMMALDLAGVACSAGAACASGSSQPSRTLLAMGLPADVVDASLRFSFGVDTQEGDIDEAVARILDTCTAISAGQRAIRSG